MNINKLIMISFAAFWLQPISSDAQVPAEQFQEQTELDAEVSQEEQAALEQEQIISLYLQIQKECSSQVDLLTAILHLHGFST